jgi:hypothetical protein
MTRATGLPDVAVTPLTIIRFLLELCLVAGLAVAGAAVAPWAAVLLPLLLAAIWGLFLAPKATRLLADPARFALEVFLFVATGAALTAAGHAIAGAALVIASTGVAVAIRRPLRS